jgi:hypothetical protein
LGIAGGHVYETEASRPSGFPIHYQLDRLDLSVPFKQLTNFIFRR